MHTVGTDFQVASALSRRLLAVATAFGLLGGGLLLLYLRRFEEEASGGVRVQVLSLVQPVERGALVTADALAVAEVPMAYLERRAIRASDKSKVVGVRAAHALEAQDTLLWSDLAIFSESRDLSSLVQPGKRALTIRASETGSDPSSSGLIRPGDYVDVLVTLRDESDDRKGGSVIVLLQRILVLAVGGETEPQGLEEARASTEDANRERQLTLSLKTEEVQLLSLARERGTLSVALREPTDTKIVEGIADMPLSVLYDKKSRESVQREVHSRQVASQAPVRLTSGAP